MRDHFEQVRGVQVGVIQGDLEAVRAAARWVATHEALAGMPESWEAYVADMREAAEVAAEAADIEAAAMATANMAKTCAACHEDMQRFPQFLDVAKPADSDETLPHMIGHMWAADRMWRGLVTPSTVSWNNGVAALGGDPLDAESFSVDDATVEKVVELAHEVHELAATGRRAPDQEVRAEVMGQFLGTCAECHRLLGVGGEH
jgi:mono/diheme cytochrome c family protein